MSWGKTPGNKGASSNALLATLALLPAHKLAQIADAFALVGLWRPPFPYICGELPDFAFVGPADDECRLLVNLRPQSFILPRAPAAATPPEDSGKPLQSCGSEEAGARGKAHGGHMGRSATPAQRREPPDSRLTFQVRVTRYVPCRNTVQRTEITMGADLYLVAAWQELPTVQAPLLRLPWSSHVPIQVGNIQQPTHTNLIIFSFNQQCGSREGWHMGKKPSQQQDRRHESFVA